MFWRGVARVSGALRRVSPHVVMLVAWAAFLLYAFPGEVTWDAVNTLLEARSGIYTDQLPPAMATLWLWVEQFVAGSFGMVALQSGALLAGLYLIFRRVLSPRGAAWAAGILLVYPPVMVPLAFVGPEGLMAGFLVFGVGGLVSAPRGLRIAGVVAIVAASLVRYEAWVATLPIVVLLLRVGPLRGWRRHAGAAVVWLAVTFSASGINRALTDHAKHGWHMTVAVHDIVGTLAFVDRDLPDDELRATLAGTGLRIDHDIQATARKLYSPRDPTTSTTGTLALWTMPYFGRDTLPDAQLDAIERARSSLIAQHRGAYLRHRVTVSAQVFAFARRNIDFPRRDNNDPVLLRAMGLATHWSDAQFAATDGAAWMARATPLFTPWVYVVVALVLLAFARRQRDTIAVLASGLCLAGWLVINSPGRALVQTHWIVICACIAIVLVVARRRYGLAYEETEHAEPPVRAWLRALPSRAIARIRALTAVGILAIGWLVHLAYAFPGYMSYDSVYQLLEARSGVFTDGHPPAMSALWQLVDTIIAGPFGMLVLQTVTFLVGAYWVLRHAMSKRAAAVCASIALLFPPIGTVMAVIWKDSQMAGLLMLGTGLVLSPRRGIRVLALVVLAAGTAMRHNALAMTFPIIVLLFTWSPKQRWFLRYPLAVAAWVAVTLSAQVANKALTVRELNLWPRSLALMDIVGTLRHMDPMPDAELAPLLEGTPLGPRDHLHEHAKAPLDPKLGYIDGVWTVTWTFIRPPETAEERAAVVRAWKAIVPAHPAAYLAYRWDIFVRLVQLVEPPPGSAAYVWFTDVLDPPGSAEKIEHNALPSGLQDELRDAAGALGATSLFRVYVYLFLSLALLWFCLRDRVLLAVLASGLTGEAGLFMLAPTTDYRYSFWLVISTVLVVMMLIATRARKRAKASPESSP